MIRPLLSVLIPFFTLSSSSWAADLYLHGEIHHGEKCRKQRQELAGKAESGKIELFSENVLSAEENPAWLEIRNREFMGITKLEKVHPLETPLSWAIGIFYSLYADFQTDLLQAKLTPKNDAHGDLHSERLHYLLRARGSLDAFLAQNSFCTEEPLKSIFCPEISDEVKKLSALKDHELEAYLHGPGNDLFGRVEKIVRDQKAKVSHEMEIPAEPVTAEEMKIALASDPAAKGPGEIAYLVVWRNFFMQKKLSQVLTAETFATKRDVHVVLGAAHVWHFHHTLLRDYPELAKRYTIRESFACLEGSFESLYRPGAQAIPK